MTGSWRRRKRKWVQQRRKKRRKTRTLRSKKRSQVQIRAEERKMESLKDLLRPGFITDREKVAEEKEKDKETLTAAETADAKAKSEVLDLKKGVSEAKLRLPHSKQHLH